jgi:hypothetical protein
MMGSARLAAARCALFAVREAGPSILTHRPSKAAFETDTLRAARLKAVDAGSGVIAAPANEPGRSWIKRATDATASERTEAFLRR